jgi:23S rRNA (uracil1939-C5)-methyltransferase
MQVNFTPQTPFCPHFERCGGCTLQHLNLEDYRALKVERLRQALVGAGLNPAIQPLLSVPQASRRRTTMVVRKDKSGILVLGYHPAQSHAVTDISTCPILVEALQDFLPLLRQKLQNVDFKQADIALVHTGQGIDLQWIGPLTLSQQKQMVAALVLLPDVQRISYGEGESAEVLHTSTQPRVCLAGVEVDLPVGAFLQASEAGEKLLQQAVVEYCQGQHVADLFCGLGTFSLALLKRGKKVFAVDSAVVSLKALNAAVIDLPLRVIERDLFKYPLDAEALSPFETIVVDPPRAGLRGQCQALAKAAANQIIYVSCNPQTFAQDAITLIAGGYSLQSIQPVDQFVWSNHLELVADFRR